MQTSLRRVLLIDPSDGRREVLARRLRAQGYVVDAISEATMGADMALRDPPSAVVADLWMPSISGVQLCRLLRSEPATVEVPVVLCSDRDEPRNRFWAERAGATAYVIKGRTGELVRALARAMDQAPSADDGFFVQLSGGSVDIRDRLARHLDTALFESIIAAELRALANTGSFERLFDSLAQFMSQVTRYRWIALATTVPARLAIHHHPTLREAAEREARAALGVPESATVIDVEDEDATTDEGTSEPIVCSVLFASVPVARFAIGPSPSGEQDAGLLAAIVGRELGGAIKIAMLVEESQRQASTDPLTGLMNRRAFESTMRAELARCDRHNYPLSLVLLDVDNFKKINDRWGHGIGDRVLEGIGGLLRRHLRQCDFPARWGGEEFVVALTSTDAPGARIAAERLRVAIEGLVIHDDGGARVAVTASLGLAGWRPTESLEGLIGRADAAMYASKASGRNCVSVCAQHDDADEAPISGVA